MAKKIELNSENLILNVIDALDNKKISSATYIQRLAFIFQTLHLKQTILNFQIYDYSAHSFDLDEALSLLLASKKIDRYILPNGKGVGYYLLHDYSSKMDDRLIDTIEKFSDRSLIELDRLCLALYLLARNPHDAISSYSSIKPILTTSEVSNVISEASSL